MEDKFLCEKYKQLIDIKKICPHPDDYCQFRTRCIINYRFLESRETRDRKKEEKH
ncbi:MAG: hypothetical protein KBI10_01015 [Syntrophorhabdales bacterium]|nr:hypothetical protein [Syntrophorhabdales bacterium]